MVQVRKQSGKSRTARAAGPARSRPASPKHAAASKSPLDTLLDPELFKALCDPTRVSLLACLAKCGRACSVGEVAECCRVDLSVVSRHLAQLADAGVLESSKQGRTVLYRVLFTDLSAKLRAIADAIDSCCPEGSCGTGCGGGESGGCCG